jgi:hypothetical protein
VLPVYISIGHYYRVAGTGEVTVASVGKGSRTLCIVLCICNLRVSLSLFTCQIFIDNLCRIDIVPEDEWFETLFGRLYGALRVEMRSPASSPDETVVDRQWHLVQGDELALFFCVLALGALTDLSSEPFNSEAEFYYSTSRALMTTESILTEPTICSIQTLVRRMRLTMFFELTWILLQCLASYYEGLRSQKNSSRNCWTFMMLASKTAHIVSFILSAFELAH